MCEYVFECSLRIQMFPKSDLSEYEKVWFSGTGDNFLKARQDAISEMTNFFIDRLQSGNRAAFKIICEDYAVRKI